MRTTDYTWKRKFPTLPTGRLPVAGKLPLGPLPGAPKRPGVPGIPPVSQVPTAPPWEADPQLQRIRALAKQNVASAEAANLAQRKTSLFDFGYDETLKNLYPDAASAEAARQNPFSVLANLRKSHDERTYALNENLNRSNLFYSGERGKELGNEATAYLGEQSQAQTALQQALAGFSQSLLGVKQTEAGNIAGAEGEAQQRALEFALKYGTDPAIPVMPAGGYKLPTSGLPKRKTKLRLGRI